MAKNLQVTYPGKVTTGDALFPYGKPKNVNINGDGTGTPFEAEWASDIAGFFQHLLVNANIVPSNLPDNALKSQYVEAISYIANEEASEVVDAIDPATEAKYVEATTNISEELINENLNITTSKLINNAEAYNIGDVVLTSGYYYGGDGGGASWRRTGLTGQPASQSPSDLVDGRLNDAGGAQWTIVNSGNVNVLAFGAVRDNVTDSTLQFEAAAKYASDIAFNGQSSVGWDAQSVAKLKIPSGSYVYNGAGLNKISGMSLTIEGDGKSNTNITLGASSWFLRLTATPRTLTMKGITFLGGLGAYYDEGGSSVSGGVSFEQCSFLDYTLAGIGFNNASADRPNVSVHKCDFSGDPTTQNFGVIIPGGGGHVVNDCWFNQGYISVVLGSYQHGSEATITNNRYGRTAAQVGRRIRVWVKTGTFPFEGSGIRLVNEKFGSENLSVDDSQVLFCSGNGNNAMLTDFPIEAANTAPITDVQILNSVFDGTDAFAPAAVDTWTNNFKNCTISEIFFGGTPPVSVINSLNTAQNNNPQTKNTRISYTSQNDTTRGNIPVGFPIVADNSNAIGQSADSLIYGGGYDSGFHEMLTQRDTFAFLQLGGTSTKTQVVDSLGGNTAAECTVVESNVRLPVLSGDIVRAGEVVWVEFDVKRADSNTADSLIFQYQASSSQVQQKRLITLSDEWVRVRLPIIQEVTGTDIALAWYAVDGVTSGVDDKFQIGVPAVYRARSPVPYYGHTRTADSAWDTSHVVLGDYHLWVDAVGALRIKSSAPTSDLDGVTVGSQ